MKNSKVSSAYVFSFTWKLRGQRPFTLSYRADSLIEAAAKVLQYSKSATPELSELTATAPANVYRRANHAHSKRTQLFIASRYASLMASLNPDS